MSNLPDDTNWAVTEFADAELGDERRTTRLVELAHVLAQHPTAALPEACGSGAMLKGAYRFFSNDAIAPQDVLASHIEATYGRLARVPVVLGVQDTPEVTWTAHPATTGLGPLGHTACQGLLVHSTLAFTPERVPLGLLAQQVWARRLVDTAQVKADVKQVPMRQLTPQERFEDRVRMHQCAKDVEQSAAILLNQVRDQLEERLLKLTHSFSQSDDRYHFKEEYLAYRVAHADFQRAVELLTQHTDTIRAHEKFFRT